METEKGFFFVYLRERGKAIACLFEQEDVSVETIAITPGSGFTGDIHDPKTLEACHRHVMQRLFLPLT